jgi:hypothetical protein
VGIQSRWEYREMVGIKRECRNADRELRNTGRRSEYTEMAKRNGNNKGRLE